jgi:hypothetical protein
MFVHRSPSPRRHRSTSSGAFSPTVRCGAATNGVGLRHGGWVELVFQVKVSSGRRRYVVGIGAVNDILPTVGDSASNMAQQHLHSACDAHKQLNAEGLVAVYFS